MRNDFDSDHATLQNFEVYVDSINERQFRFDDHILDRRWYVRRKSRFDEGYTHFLIVSLQCSEVSVLIQNSLLLEFVNVSGRWVQDTMQKGPLIWGSVTGR